VTTGEESDPGSQFTSRVHARYVTICPSFLAGSADSGCRCRCWYFASLAASNWDGVASDSLLPLDGGSSGTTGLHGDGTLRYNPHTCVYGSGCF
jgi:hypothetical protein